MFTIIARSAIASTPSMSIVSVSIIILPLLLLALPLFIELLSITKEFEPMGAKERTQAC
jgi:hypothetical protein